MSIDPTKLVPLSAWEQISVVIVFALLLGGLGWLLVRLFTQSISDINAHYAKLLDEQARQWRDYFDARSETTNKVSGELLEKLNEVAQVLDRLVSNFNSHDEWERRMQQQNELPPPSVPRIVRRK